MADGYIRDNKSYVVELALKGSDINHLHKFIEALEGNNVISTRLVKLGDKVHTSSRVIFSSKKMVEDLTNLGCGNKKSLTLAYPDIPEGYEIPFIRGYFDGDGTIKVSNYRRGPKVTGISITSGSVGFLSEYASRVGSLIGTTPRLHYPNNRCTYIDITKGVPANDFLYLIYNNAKVYLDRKYDTFKNYVLPSYEETHRITSGENQ